jgi:predicted dienelactone hydrolase
MLWLGHFLALHGYIVAAVNHHGNTGAEPVPDARGFLLWWERAKDLSAVLDRLLSDPVFGTRIDRGRIGAAGFSLGGYTVITVAGGRLDKRRYDRFCNSPARDFTCGPQPEFPDAPRLFQELADKDPVIRSMLQHAGDSYLDTRIRAVFAVAPVFGSGFDAAGLSAIKVPVKIVVGLGDTTAPPASNAQRYAALIRGSDLVLLPRSVTHYTFVPECTEQGKKSLERICHDEPGTDRSLVHAQVSALAYEFFERTLPAARR